MSVPPSIPKLSLGLVTPNCATSPNSPTSIIIYSTPRNRVSREQIKREGNTPRHDATPRHPTYDAAAVAKGDNGDIVMKSAVPAEATDSQEEVRKPVPAPKPILLPVTPRSSHSKEDMTRESIDNVPHFALDDLHVAVYGATYSGLSTAFVLARTGAAVTVCDGRELLMDLLNDECYEEFHDELDEEDCFPAIKLTLKHIEMCELYAASNLDAAGYSDVVLVCPPEVPAQEKSFSPWWNSVVEQVFEVGQLIQPGTLVIVESELFAKRQDHLFSILNSSLEGAYYEADEQHEQPYFFATVSLSKSATTIRELLHSKKRAIYGLNDFSVALARQFYIQLQRRCPPSLTSVTKNILPSRRRSISADVGDRVREPTNIRSKEVGDGTLGESVWLPPSLKSKKSRFFPG